MGAVFVPEMNPWILRAASLFAVYVLRHSVDTTDPVNVQYIRILFSTSKLIELAVYALIWKEIKSSDDTRTIKVSPSDIQPPNPLTKALQPEQFSGLPEEMTIPEYDTKMMTQKIVQLTMQCCVVGFLHFYNGLCIPLILSSFMGLWNLQSDHLFQIHLRGSEAVDELKRPFKIKPPLGDLMRPWQERAEAQKRQEEKRAL